MAQPVALDDPAAVEPWIQERRREWFEAIRYPEQRWSIQMKIDRSCGAATFLGFRLDPAPPDGDSPDGAIGWTAWAVGDICLFHIRDGQLIASFPIGASADFNTTPQLYQSKAMRPTPQAVVTRGELRPDDLLVFATDATAQRLLAEVEAGTPPGLGPVLGPGPGGVAAGDRGDPRPERDRQRRLHPGGAPAPGPGRRTRRDEPEPAGESPPQILDEADAFRSEASVEPHILAPESEPETLADPAPPADADAEAGGADDGTDDSPDELTPPAGGAL